MSLRNICLSILLFQLTTAFAQTEVVTVGEIYKNRVTYPDNVLPLVDQSGERFSIVLFNGKVVNGYLFDKNHQLQKQLITEEKASKYKQVFGKTIAKNNDFVVFVTNSKRKKFASLRLDFENNEIEFKELELDLGNEKIIQTAEYNNKFHILTIAPRTAIINVYRFENATTYTTFPIDFSEHVFLNAKQKEEDLYQMITVNSSIYGFAKSIDLAKIEPDNPTALEVACNPTKLYQEDNRMILTFDANENITQLVEIDLETLNGKVKIIEKAMVNWAYKERNSNSFLHNSILYQIVTTKRALHLRAVNYNTKAIINEYSTNSNEAIQFKNSSITQTGGPFDDYREFDDTATLLRKVRRGKAGLAVYDLGEKLQVTYGGVIERSVNPGGMMMIPGFGLPLATFGAVTVYFNPTFFAYQSYTLTKAIFVDALFNDAFEHEAGAIEENVFERIKTFEEDAKIQPPGRTVFTFNNSIYLGSYDSFSRTYSIHSF